MVDGAGETFGALVRRFRRRAALSQEALAERAGLSVDAVSVIERRTRGVPRPDTVALLARALELGPAERAAFAAAAHPHSAPAAAAPAGPPAGAMAPMVSVLPVELTSFIGREREVAAVCARLCEPGTRLLTLTGTGGVGKTRLALAVAARLLDRLPVEVRLVELAPLADPAVVPGAVARALGLREEPGRPLLDTLTGTLRGRRLLLVLDNCEYLVDACAALAGALLRGCPELRLLATSRAALGLSGERRYRVPPLSVPDPQHLPPAEQVGSYEAVRLFVARAQERRDDFALTEGNAWAVATICARLDGIPLAIELAAARVEVLPVEAIVERLEARFRLLTGGPRDAPSRQQTLRATLDWSWELLDEPERIMLRRLSVFACGWTLDAAEQVCAGAGVEPDEILDLLDRLVDQSLAQPDERGEEARYRLLETVRQYAAEQLVDAGEEAAVRDRHLEWCVTLAEEAEPQLTGPEQGAWLTRLEGEHDNLRAALGWSMREESRSPIGVHLAGALWRFWSIHGHLGEGRGWLEKALVHDPIEPSADRARALHGAGSLAQTQGEHERARARYEESLALWRDLGDRRGVAASLNSLGNVAIYQGDHGRARTCYEESLALFRGLGDKQAMADPIHNLGLLAYSEGDLEQARTLFEESLALSRELGDKKIANTLHSLGMVAHAQGDQERARGYFEQSLALHQESGATYDSARARVGLGTVMLSQGADAQARAMFEDALALFRDLGVRGGIAAALSNLGRVAHRQGNQGEARALFAESLALWRDVGQKQGMASGFEGLAMVAEAMGQAALAARLFGAAEALREAIGAPLRPLDRADQDQAVAAVCAALGEGAFGQAWAAGRALSLEQAIASALGADPSTPGG
jgi:non-specific serine/threonine protein kinase